MNYEKLIHIAWLGRSEFRGKRGMLERAGENLLISKSMLWLGYVVWTKHSPQQVVQVLHNLGHVGGILQGEGVGQLLLD